MATSTSGATSQPPGNKAASSIARWTAAESRSVAGPGAYTFYANNLPLTILVPLGGQGDLARINIQRFDRSHPHANSSLQTGYYWQIEGLNARAERPRATRST